MWKTVEKPIKVDLHIHSNHSIHREKGGLTKNCTLKNINILINNLKKNEVDVFAITDHDVFSYELYSELKKKEKDGTFLKIFPGVEFSVSLKKADGKDWPVHVIAIFNDEDDEKVKNIEAVLGDGIKKLPTYTKNSYFSQAELIELLDKIGLDVVFIAHQKQTLTSDSDPKLNDLNGVGKENFNKFLFSEFFQALEFHDKKNDLFNTKAKNSLGEDLLRFITGSDCHDWDVYPKHDKKIKDDNFCFTFLKCLPTFRGLALALTDYNRINLRQSFFSASDKFESSIKLSINGEEYNIPLSKGINAIIGDNSIGKSLLLHKITDYYRETEDPDTSIFNIVKNLKAKYELYLEKRLVSIETKIEKDKIFEFDTQGEIRRKFSEGKINANRFIASRAPNNLSIENAKTKVVNCAKSYLDYLKGIADGKHSLDILQNSRIKLIPDVLEATVLKLTSINIVNLSNEKAAQGQIVNEFEKAKEQLITLLPYTNNNEKKRIMEFITFLGNVKQRYSNKVDFLQEKIDVCTKINSAINHYEQTHLDSTDDDKVIANFENDKQLLYEALINYLKISDRDSTFENPHIDQFSIPTEKIEYGDYKIVNCSPISLINDDYLLSLFKKPLNLGKFTRSTFESSANLQEALSRYNGQEKESWDYYWSKINDQILQDIQSTPKINKLEDEDGEDKSQGFDQKMYFKVICSDAKKQGIYIIDQPEDDISQTSIRDELIKDLKKMSRYRQVILVTHNPQFVVNLDVDNVICLIEGENKEIIVHNGALEYKDKDVDILKDVAETLDGGVMTIRRRWKRYEKNIDDIIG